MNKNSMGYTIVFIFLVSFAFVLLLSLTNVFTVEQIDNNRELARKRAVLSAMGIEFENAEDILARYEAIRGDVDQGLYVYAGPDATIYAKRFIGAGLWGGIEGVLAVTANFDRIVGIEIVSQNETPGLGGRITEGWFKEQFRNERIPVEGFSITSGGDGDGDTENGAVDGITGATRTSDSVEKIVRSEILSLQSDEIRRQLRNLET